MFQWHDLICSGDMTCLTSPTKLQLSTKTAFDHDLKPQKPPYTPFPPPNPTTVSTSHPGCLVRHPLRPHLALDPAGLAPRGAGRTLGFLGLLLALGRGLLLFPFRNGFFSCCFSGLGTLRTAVLDDFV